VIVGCDDSIAPFSEESGYSVYGNLSFQSERHFFRVRPLSTPLDASPKSLPADVTLTNTSTGNQLSLQDSVIVFDGTRTHNYWVKFKVDPTTTYELTVKDPTRPTTRVRTTTPTDVNPVVTPERADECGELMELRFREAKAPRRVSFGFWYQGEKHWVRPFGDIESTPRRDDFFLQFQPAGVLSQVIPHGLRQPPPCTQLDDPTLQIEYLYTDPERTTDEVSPEITYDPTEQERIENGVGFFGAYRRDTMAVEVDTTLSLPGSGAKGDLGSNMTQP
jgi:hypothetical protein